jgi:hypothetical protein
MKKLARERVVPTISACFSTPTICSTLNRFFFISKILRPLQARFLPKTNIQIGSKIPGPIMTIEDPRRYAQCQRSRSKDGQCHYVDGLPDAPGIDVIHCGERT